LARRYNAATGKYEEPARRGPATIFPSNGQAVGNAGFEPWDAMLSRGGEFDSRLDETTITSEIREVNMGFNRMARELAKVEEDRAVMLAGISHDLRTPIARGIEIIEQLRGWTTGFAVPHLAVDLPGGGGKVTIQPEYLIERQEKQTLFRNYRGKTYAYPEPEEQDCSCPYDAVWTQR
jgi:signal transduction histidine kinase